MQTLDSGMLPRLAHIAYQLGIEPNTGRELDNYMGLIVEALRIAEEFSPHIGFDACASAIDPEGIATTFQSDYNKYPGYR